jgi:hypothetical protein
MKKLVLLLSTLLILSTLVSSPVLAARSSIMEFRMHAMMTFLCRNMFLVRGMIVAPESVLPANNGGGASGFVGGDADDYGNGRGSDVTEWKPLNKLIGGGTLGPDNQGPETRKSVCR